MFGLPGSFLPEQGNLPRDTEIRTGREASPPAVHVARPRRDAPTPAAATKTASKSPLTQVRLRTASGWFPYPGSRKSRCPALRCVSIARGDRQCACASALLIPPASPLQSTPSRTQKLTSHPPLRLLTAAKPHRQSSTTSTWPPTIHPSVPPIAMSSNGSQQQQQRPPAVSAAADAEMQKVFSRIDADGDGRISPSELAAVSRAISPPATSSHGRREVAAMMDELDTDRDGFVDLGEFKAFHARGPGSGALDAELRAAFDVYDVDGDGRITAADLGKVLARIGEGCSAEECERMIANVDADGDGCVGFEEFKKMMCPQPEAEAGAGDAAAAGTDKAKEE